MSAAARGVGGAYVRHPISGRIYAEGSDEAAKILAGEIHATRTRAEMAETNSPLTPTLSRGQAPTLSPPAGRGSKSGQASRRKRK